MSQYLGNATLVEPSAPPPYVRVVPSPVGSSVHTLAPAELRAVNTHYRKDCVRIDQNSNTVVMKRSDLLDALNLLPQADA